MIVEAVAGSGVSDLTQVNTLLARVAFLEVELAMARDEKKEEIGHTQHIKIAMEELRKQCDGSIEQHRQVAVAAQKHCDASIEHQRLIAVTAQMEAAEVRSKCEHEKKVLTDDCLRNKLDASSWQAKYRDSAQSLHRLRARREAKYQPEFKKAKRHRIFFGKLRHVLKHRSLRWTTAKGLDHHLLIGHYC